MRQYLDECHLNTPVESVGKWHTRCLFVEECAGFLFPQSMVLGWYNVALKRRRAAAAGGDVGTIGLCAAMEVCAEIARGGASEEWEDC